MRLIGWRVAVQLFYVGVVLIVFANLEGRTEHIIVALAGLLYVAVRTNTIGTALMTVSITEGLQEEFDAIKFAVIPGFTFNVEAHDETKEMLRKAKQSVWIQWCGLGVISLICLAELLITLA